MKEKTLIQRIVETLTDKELTTREVAEAIGAESLASVSRIQSKAVKNGLIIEVGKRLDSSGRKQTVRTASSKHKPPISRYERLRRLALEALEDQSMTQRDLARYLRITNADAGKVTKLMQEKGEIRTTGRYTGPDDEIEYIYTTIDSNPSPISPRYEGKEYQWPRAGV